MKNTFFKLLGCAGVALLLLPPLRAQVDDTPHIQPLPAGVSDASNETASTDVPMLVPPPVSGALFKSAPVSQERSNYLRGGMVFTGAYSDNVLGGSEGHPVSDESYSLAPTIELDKSTSRMLTILKYAPGFTFYQHTGALNQSDENAAIQFQYRLSPHLTFSARDNFSKSSNVLNQPDLAMAGGVPQGPQTANFSIVAPIADRLSNSGNVELTYQLSANSMVGASGSFSNLHYPNPLQVPGLFDASSQSGSAFYSYRIARRHYVGATYQYEKLVSYPTGGSNQTQTNGVLLFYSFYPTPRFSFSLFGGPEHSNTIEPLVGPPLPMWSPAAGAGVNWTRAKSSFAINYSHLIASGGGLIGAVQLDSASGSLEQAITKSFGVSIAGGYAQNDLLERQPLNSTNGHSIFGTISVHQQMSQHLYIAAGYTRLRQTYSNIPLISGTPVTNRESVSLSYQFERALGR
jgi:hypothetical protein